MIEACPKRNIFIVWLTWHYIEALKGVTSAWLNFLAFNSQYFSFTYLLKTLLSPWKRDLESYGRGFDIKVWARTLLLNIFSRILGAIVRLVLLCFGLMAEVFIFFSGLLFIITWLLFPLIIISGIYCAIVLLI